MMHQELFQDYFCFFRTKSVCLFATLCVALFVTPSTYALTRYVQPLITYEGPLGRGEYMSIEAALSPESDREEIYYSRIRISY